MLTVRVTAGLLCLIRAGACTATALLGSYQCNEQNYHRILLAHEQNSLVVRFLLYAHSRTLA